MHSLLALGRSHLSFGESLTSHRADETKHRAVAIRGVNNILAKSHWSTVENDAVLATLYALMFASSYSGDSIFEFFTLGRAVNHVNMRLQQAPRSSCLVPGQLETHSFIIGLKERLLPYRIEQHPVSEGLKSVKQLDSFQMNETEAHLYGLLLKTLKMLQAWDTSGKCFI